MQQIYIYCLKDSDNNIRYIGKTTNPKRRFYYHIRDSKKYSNRYVCRWINKLLEDSKKPIMEIIEICNSDNWREREKFWIAYYRTIIPNLCNILEGGDIYPKWESLSQELKIVHKNRFVQMARTIRCKFTEEEKFLIWEMMQLGKSFEDIREIYPNLSRQINFGVRNGKQWNYITCLQATPKKVKRKGYTCINKGLFIVRDKSDKRKVIFSSRDENDVIAYLENVDR